MEGLEVSVLTLEEAIATDPTGRLDSSFFERRFLDLRKYAETWDRLDTHAESVTCGPFGSNLLNENYVEQGIPMIRPFNLGSCRVDSGEIALLEDTFVVNAGLKTFGQGTVMFARVGEIGAGVSTYEKATISPNIIAAELGESINAYFVAVFSNTKYGRTQLEAGMKVVAQPTISTDSIRALRVPRLSGAFQQKIEETFMRAVQAEDDSCLLLAKAESTLQQACGLDAWTPPEALSYVRSSNEAFAAGRFDAEYFHPAKAQALADLRAASNVCVGDLFDSIRELWQPAEATSGPVRNYDLTDALNPFLDPTKRPVAPEEIASTKKQIAAGDLVVSRLRSYLREIAVVLPGDQVLSVASTEFVVLRPKKGSPLSVEALLIYLRSRLPQIVFKWSQDGSNHPRFDERELLNLPLPKVLISGQASYLAAVREMVAQRQRATQLLDAAKRAVEIAIEDSEAAALANLEALK
ncbi:MAG: restriction endonuclease subunit S [Rhizobacter sp.]